MFILESIMSASEADKYESLFWKAAHMYLKENFYGSLVIETIILALAIYFITIKRWQRFEWTILLCMFIKYSFYIFD